jgi:hypothetical protein
LPLGALEPERFLRARNNSKPNRTSRSIFQHDYALRSSAVFWTIFTLLILLWMIVLAADFGAGVMPTLLVLGTILTLMNFVFRRRTLI